MTTADLVARAQLPRMPKLAPGRSVLWRTEDSVQFGLGESEAMVLTELTPALAALIKAMDGTASATRLVGDAVVAGAEPEQAVAVIEQLQQAGLVLGDPQPPRYDRSLPGADSAVWSAHSGLPAGELLRLRRAASVQVQGSGRVAVALAITLAAAGIGRVQVSADGTVTSADVGTGYLPADVGRPRAQAAHGALLRSVPTVRTEGFDRAGPHVVILTDSVVCDPHVTADLVARRIPHLPAHAHEGVVTTGPLVVPGRSSCLRCLHLRRTDLDPAWPKLATQLTGTPTSSDLACAQLAAGMAAEQVLAVLTGPTSGLGRPPSWGATVELDPVQGRLRRRVWEAHPDCGCGAAATTTPPPGDRAERQPACGLQPGQETIVA